MELNERLKTILKTVVIVVLLLAVGYGGWGVRGWLAAKERIALEKSLSDCQAEQQQAIANGTEAAGWAMQIEVERDQLKREREQLKKDYDDSLRIIRAMLPDRAERAIADYYRSRKN